MAGKFGPCPSDEAPARVGRASGKKPGIDSGSVHRRAKGLVSLREEEFSATGVFGYAARRDWSVREAPWPFRGMGSAVHGVPNRAKPKTPLWRLRTRRTLASWL